MSIVEISADHPRYFDRGEGHSVFRVRPPLFRKGTYRCPPTVPFGQNDRWNKIRRVPKKATYIEWISEAYIQVKTK